MPQLPAQTPLHRQDSDDHPSRPLIILTTVVITICFLALLQLLIRGSDGLYLQ